MIRRPPLRRERDTRWTLAVAVLGVLATVVALVALVARTIDWTWQPAIVVASFAHQFLWAAPVGVVLLAVLRRWYSTGVAAVVLVLAVLTQLPLYTGTDVPAGGTRLTVMQANLKLGDADPGSIVRTVRSRGVDLLMTEELTTTEQARLIAAGLSRMLPYRYSAPLHAGGGGLGMWSRYRLTDVRNYPHYSLGVLSATAHVSAATTVTVFAVHLLPPYPYPPAEWAAETVRLRHLLQPIAGPVVVAGDFNATTDNVRFRDLLTHGYADAAEHVGAGYLPTYPADRFTGPLIAIDHVLTRDADAANISTISLQGSDHRGLLTHIRLRG